MLCEVAAVEVEKGDTPDAIDHPDHGISGWNSVDRLQPALGIGLTSAFATGYNLFVGRLPPGTPIAMHSGFQSFTQGGRLMRLNNSARGFAVVCVAAVAMVLSACGQAQPDVASDAQSQTAAVNEPANKATTARAQTRNQAKKGSATTAATTGTSPAPDPASKAAQEPEAVSATITGCLEERKDQTFRLKNTVGDDAPKSRGWKSGFLKKGTASIDLVDAGNRMKLHNHVGEQISVTGMLADKEMQVRSVKRVAESCE